MKKPFTLSELSFTIIKVCLVLGIFVSLVSFYSNSDREQIVINGLPAGTSSETSRAESAVSLPATAVTALTSAASSAPDVSAVSRSTESVFSEAEPAPPEEIPTASAVSEMSAAQVTSPPEITEVSSSGTQNGSLININSADTRELIKLSGIGEVKAAAIVAYREEHGAFSSVEELLNVKGIGEKTLEKIRGYVTV